MKRLCLLVFFINLLIPVVFAQVIDSTVCDILKDPQSFDGKTVRIKGTALAGFDEFVVKSAECKSSGTIWLSYPEGTKGKAGPVAFIQLQLAKNSPAQAAELKRDSVKLDKNKDFKQFDSLLSTPYKGKGMCLGCVRYTANATFVGRLDASKQTGAGRNPSGQFVSVSGFGNLNLYKARLVLQSVSDVTAEEIDYSKLSVATKDDNGGEGGGGDPVAEGRQAAGAFSSGSAAAQQLTAAAKAYGEQGEQNGVEISFGTPNEVPRSDVAKGTANSPDGLLLNCTFDMDRLKGNALSRAMSHVGSHIADVRNNDRATPYELEVRGWQTAVLSSVAYKQKTLIAPGGYLLWDKSWPAGENNRLLNEAIEAFVTEWLGFRK